MLAGNIVKYIEQFAPIEMQEDWDNSGFCIGDAMCKVNGALLALDCSEEVVDEAIELGLNMVITHHPLIFNGVKRIAPNNSMGRIIEKVIKNNMVIYSAHTNLDRVSGGVSSLMAERLQLQDCKPLSDKGFGVVGNLSAPMTSEEFVKYMKQSYGIELVRCSKLINEPIKRVAVCGGSGKFLIGNAMAEGAQVYITGDISYHDYYCERGFMLIDLGHYLSEFDAVILLQNLISKNFPNFAVSISKKNNNPIYYY